MIKNSLYNGNQKGYSLFNEARNNDNFLKIKNHPFLKEYYNAIKTYAEGICYNKLPDLSFHLFHQFSIDGNRIIYEREYFTRWKILFSLAAVTLIDQTDQYINQIEDMLWDFCDQYTWALPAHLPTSLEGIKNNPWLSEEFIDLFAAETGFSLAEINYLIGDRINPIVVDRVQRELERRILKPFMGEHMFWWETARMNWASVCAGSIGCTAIYMVKNIERLTLILQRVIGILDSYLEGFGDDGATPEGLGYWRYGFSFYVFFAELLKERTNGEIDLFHTGSKQDKKRKIAELPAALQLSNGITTNFSDSLEIFKPNIGLFQRLESIFGDMGYDYSLCSLYGEDHTNKWTYLIRDLFWGVSANIESKSRLKKGKYYFPNVQWFIEKYESLNGDLIAFAAKGGNNDEPHNHNDLGHFILHYKGFNLLPDLGCPEYTKEFFRDGTRYSFINASSLGHSVPMINGQLQKPGISSAAKVIHIKTEENSSEFLLDLTDAYSVDSLSLYTRKFELIKNNWNENMGEIAVLSIQDRFTFNRGGNNVIEAFITHYKPEVLKEGQIKISEKDVAVLMQYDSGKCSAAIEEHEYSGHFGEKKIAFRIVLTLLNEGEDILFHVCFSVLK
jgi:hypothetical protein